MSGLDLGKQVGPLPVGAWIAVVGTGLGIAYYTRGGGSPGTVGDTTSYADTSGVPGVGDGSVGGWTQTGPAPAPATDTPDVAAITDNIGWGQRAITWLIAQGYAPGDANNAVNKALGGPDYGKMSVKEYALWTVVLAHFGAPPEPVVVLPPVSTPGPVLPKPPPPKTPTPPPVKRATGHWYVVRHGDTLSGIAKRSYGHAYMYVRIYNANRKGVHRPDGSRGMIVNPNRISTGWRLYIPK